MRDCSGFSNVVVGFDLDFVNATLLAFDVAARRGGIAQRSFDSATLTRMMMVDARVADVKELRCGHWSVRTRLDSR